LSENGITDLPPEGWQALAKLQLIWLKLSGNQLSAIPPEGWDELHRIDPLGPLSRFVILDPSWVTELVAKVLRDRTIRDQLGRLKSSDLDRLWET
jgi:C-terminal of Roc, COR, domain